MCQNFKKFEFEDRDTYLYGKKYAGKIRITANTTVEQSRGEIIAEVDGLNLDVAIAYGLSDTNHVEVSAPICSVNISSAKITLDGQV